MYLCSLILLCLCLCSGGHVFVLVFIMITTSCGSNGLNGFLPLQLQWLPRVNNGSLAGDVVGVATLSLRYPHALLHVGEVV